MLLKNKKIYCLFMVLLLSLIFSQNSFAKDKSKILQAYSQGKEVNIFAFGDIDIDNLHCKVSGKKAEIITRSKLSEKNIKVRTTFLIDSSKSMPKLAREKLKEYLDEMIEKINPNEEYEIVSFEKKVKVIQAFSSDRFDLSKAIDKLSFNGKESRIYDVLYKYLEKFEAGEKDDFFYRIILITDGIDVSEDGYNWGELFSKIKEIKYPVEVIAVSSKPQKADKNLAAIARQSSGRVINLNPKSDIKKLFSAFQLDKLSWFKVRVPARYLDGVKRPFELSDGSKQFDFDVRVSAIVSDDAGETEVKKKDGAGAEKNIEQKVDEEAVKKIDDNLEEDLFEEETFFEKNKIYILAGGISFVLLILIIVIVVIKVSKKKKDKNEFRVLEVNKQLSETECIDPVDKKEVLLKGNGNNVYQNDGINIRLRNINNSDQIWNLSLSSPISIGRDTDCQVCLYDKSVSRWQCKIYLSQKVPMIENISSSNITQLNGLKVSTPSEIRDGDKIKCGKVVLMVDTFYGSKFTESRSSENETMILNV